MKRVLCLFAPALLAACPGDDAPPGNPDRLWLALDGNETMVRLVPEEPEPF
jgi:hypothetical protein